MLRTLSRPALPVTAVGVIALVLAAAIAAALGGAARADAKLVGLKPEFVRESTGCQTQVSGISRVLAGATELAKAAAEAERAALDKDVEQLTRGLAVEQEYCGEVAAMIGFIDANAAAAYRAIASELDARYKKILALRVASKKTRGEIDPITRRLIPLIARRPPGQPAEPRRIAGKFPSGRAVELPGLPGTWRLSGTTIADNADYAEAPPKGPAIAARATAKVTADMTCDQQRKALVGRAGAEGLVDLELPGAKEAGVVWAARYTRRDGTTAHQVTALCAPLTGGSVLGTADLVPAEQAAIADELAKLLLRMIAAHRA